MGPAPRLKFLSCFLVLSLSACSSIPSKYEWHDLGVAHAAHSLKGSQTQDYWGLPPEQVNESELTLAPGFLISMRFLGDSKLDGDFRTDFDGFLDLPYDIRVSATGLDLAGLKRKLTDLYRPYFKNSSDIKLRIHEERYWLDIRGLVQKPGRYLVNPGDSLDQVIVMAGGLMKDPAPAYVRIQKDNKIFVLDLNNYYNKGEDRQQIRGWIGGEIVFFQREIADSLRESLPTAPYRQPVQVLGQVRKPGPYSVKSGMDFVDLITEAEGFTSDADLDHLEIVRRTEGHQRIYEFDWKNFEKAPTPQEGDILVVHADRTTKMERRIQMAGIIASILSSIALIATVNSTRR